MKILKESKKMKLPASVLTDFVSNNWNEISTLRGLIESTKMDFSDGKDVTEAFEELLDAYLICTGKLEQILAHKGISTEVITESIDVQEDTTVNIDDMTVNVDNIKVKNIDDVAETEFEEPEISTEEADGAVATSGEPFEFYCDFAEPCGKSEDSIDDVKAWLSNH